MLIDKIEFLNTYEEKEHSIYFHSIHNEYMSLFYDCFSYLKKLVEEFGNDNLEEGFSQLKIIFKVLRNSIHSYEETFKDIDWELVAIFLNNLIEYDDSKETMYITKKIFEILKLLKSNKIENILYPEVKKYVSAANMGDSIGIITKDKYLDVPDELKSFEIKIITPKDLISDFKIFDLLIFIGTPYYFPQFSHVFLGRKIIYLSFNFYKNSFQPSDGNFEGDYIRVSNIYEKVTFSHNSNDIRHDMLETEEEIMIEHDSSKKWLVDYEKRFERTDEGITAVLLQFYTNKGAFYLPSSKVRVLNLTEKKPLSQISVTNLVGDEWIVLKNSTEAEYLTKKSREILGETKFNEFTQLVLNYKRLLRNQKKNFGTYEQLRLNMIKKGVPVSSAVLLRAWTTDFITKPRNLKKILSYLGYSAENLEKTFFAATSLISSRIRAGRMLQEKLAKIVDNLDKEEVAHGMRINKYYEFYLPEIGEFSIEVNKSKPFVEMEVSQKDLYQIINFKEVDF